MRIHNENYGPLMKAVAFILLGLVEVLAGLLLLSSCQEGPTDVAMLLSPAPEASYNCETLTFEEAKAILLDAGVWEALKHQSPDKIIADARLICDGAVRRNG